VIRLRNRWAILLFDLCCLLFFKLPSGFAQIVELRENQGQLFSCVRSGLHGFSSSCGANQGYEKVFLGTVVDITELSENEKRLRLSSEEVFFGSGGQEITADTNQGICLPEIHLGDRWLFFLQKVDNSRTLRLGYEGPSQPEAQATEQIAALRRLSHLKDSGMVTGNVTQVMVGPDKIRTYLPVPRHKITARQAVSGTVFNALTNSEGLYEFQSLPTGKYDLTSNTLSGLWAEDGTIDIEPHSCVEVNFDLKRDGRISGRVTKWDGTGVPYAFVEALSGPLDAEETTLVTADEHGGFEFRGLEPKRYRIGVELHAGDANAQIIYYPGTTTENDATAIELGSAQAKPHVDITLPNQSEYLQQR
jgi:hypothetical protein